MKETTEELPKTIQSPCEIFTQGKLAQLKKQADESEIIMALILCLYKASTDKKQSLFLMDEIRVLFSN